MYPALHGLIDQLPAGNWDPTWTDAKRADFLAAFADVLDWSLPVDEKSK